MRSLLSFLWVLCICHGLNAQYRNERRGWWNHHVRYFDLEDDLRDDVNSKLSLKFTMLAPAQLRVGIKENIVLEVFGVSTAVPVTLTVYDFPSKSYQLWQGSLTLSSENNYIAVQSLEINPSLLRPEDKVPKSVLVVADVGTFHRAEQNIPVSFLSGFIFIQTDKPIYNPGDTVRCRAFVSTPAFQAFNGTITMEIQNPDDITVYATSRVRANDGIYTDTYALSDMVKEGKWKVVAKFDHWEENLFKAAFEVKKYVLPAFNVTLKPKKSHFSLEDKELQVEVFAKYMYGEQVEGVAYVVFGVEMNGDKTRLLQMKQVKDLNGGIATLTMEELKRVHPNIRDLLGSSIYVKASVMTSSGSDLVEAEKSGIKIVVAPYVISFKDPLRFYKPGLPFNLKVKVSHHDGSPAPNVPVKISLLSNIIINHSGTIEVSINMPSNPVHLTLIAETVIPDVMAEQQAVKHLTVEPYIASDMRRQNYLYISVDSSGANVGKFVVFKLNIHTFSQKQRDAIQHVSYVVLSKGKIIHAAKVSVAGHVLTSTSLLVSPEMMPAFRIVAYYVLPKRLHTEVVADSVLVDMGSHCVGSLSVGPETGENSATSQPGTSFHFQVRGDPGARVGLVAVDNSVFLLSGSRLTQGKIWETVGRADTGCSPGGGRNSIGVFKDAGLIVQSNYGLWTSINQDSPCAWKSRRRRSAHRVNLRAQLEKRYSDDSQQRCCQDGMREIPMPYACRRRALYITEGWDCIVAFLRCCSEYRGEVLGVLTPPPPTTAEPTTTAPFRIYDILRESTRFDADYRYFTFASEDGPPGPPGVNRFRVMQGQPGLSGHRHQGSEGPTGRVGHSGIEHAIVLERKSSGQDLKTQTEEEEYDEEDYAPMDDIYIRTKFFESWLWTDIRLPVEVEPGNKDGLAVSPVHTVLPDSITQWGILAISASTQTGFCVAEPFNVRVWQRFFVDLRLPRTAARNEHVEVKAVLHNYMNEDLQVLVILQKTEDMCSVAFTGDHKQHVSLRARSSLLIRYTVVPLRAGELPLQVTAMARDLSGQDAIRKTLRVVVEGIQMMDVRSFVLNPAEKGDGGGKQHIHVGKAKLNSVVPNSLPETFINVRGDLLADSIENSINKDSLAALIRMPGGCVEQNLASITLPLIAAHYLDRSDQWDSVGLHRRVEAISYIQRGYENQLHYCKKDDSYPPYLNEGTSTWITAYVVKVFSMAHHFISVNKNHVCGPLLYLLRHKQLSSGAFKEDNPVFTISMTGGLLGAESRETLTAFVLIALAEAQNSVTCDDPEINTESRFRRAGEYLKERYALLKRPYSVAIACYALAISNQGCQKSLLLKAASPDHTHWPDSGNQFFTLEATGYALLALLKGGHMLEATAPFKWLNQQRRVGGGYGSTQSTMVVLQALSEYLVKKPPSYLNLQVELSVPGRSGKRWSFTRDLAHVARSSRVPLDQDFTVMASGHGQGILE
ncbi:complement C3-like isoform X2 [Brachyhypopomus gauderio]